MATTNIAADIQNITGVGTANAQFLISAQKFVVASIPKDLLKWASTVTVPGNHGGNTSDGVKITMPIGTDSVLDVSRNGFSATEVPYNMKGFIANTSSLHLATETYPKYYLDSTNTNEGSIVIVKPVPTDSETAIVLYVDSTKIDDDCDLRNAVVFHACSSEFTKLASFTTFPTISWVFSSTPAIPASPNFSNPAIPAITVGSMPILGSVSAGSLGTVPTFTPPVMSPPDWADTNTWITTEEDSEMLSARVQEIQAKVSEYGSRIQESQAIFNKENSIYQSTVQEALQELQVNAQEAQQEANLLLQKETQEYAADIQAFQSDLQKHQADVNKIITGNQAEVQEWQIENSKFVAYVQESTRYYQWAQSSVQSYIQNNSKMINRTIAAQSAAQQQGR